MGLFKRALMGGAAGAGIGAMSADPGNRTTGAMVGAGIGMVGAGAAPWAARKGMAGMNRIASNAKSSFSQARGRWASRGNTMQYGPVGPQFGPVQQLYSQAAGPVYPGKMRVAANRAKNSFRDAVRGLFTAANFGPSQGAVLSGLKNNVPFAIPRASNQAAKRWHPGL